MKPRGRSRITGTRDQPLPELVDPPRIVVEPEFERLMINWMRWRSGGLSIPVYMQYQALAIFRGGPGSYKQPWEADFWTAPLISAEAERVNRAVNALPGVQRNVVCIWWLDPGSLRDKAKRMGVRAESLYGAVIIAHEKLRQFLSLDPAPATEGKRG